MGMRARKAVVKELLLQRDRYALLEWARSVPSPLRILISLTYDDDELLRWRAIETVGHVAALQAEHDLEKVRDFIRRLLWLMNDESGGLGWHSPELIGEILVNVPVLIPEYATLLLSFLREEPFERGTHFAVYRVASVDPKPFAESASELLDSLKDPDPAIRAYAVLALKAIRGGPNGYAASELQADKSRFMLYDFDTGQLHKRTMDYVLGEALESLGPSIRNESNYYQ